MDKLYKQPWMYSFAMAITLFIAIFLFFGLCYPNHLHFHEQYQLFLFDTGYITDVLSTPGGVADLVGRFLTQFFLWGWIGAAIVAILLVCVYFLSLKTYKKGWLVGINLLPSIALWCYFCDEKALLGGVLALLLAQLSDYLLSFINNRNIRVTLRIVSVPLLYWALGPVAIVTSALYLISSVRSRDSLEIKVAIGSILLLLILPIIAQYLVAIPLKRLYLSPHYYRDLLVVPQNLWLAVALTILVSVLPVTSISKWKTLAVSIAVAVIGVVTINSAYNRSSEDVMSYDFMCRYQQWNRLTAKASQKKPRNSLSCTALNLALAMKGQLGDMMFEYNQNGHAGLLPDFERDPVITLTTSEVYYQLGLINTAQRFVFEAQEAISDYQKSGRCYKRLAETNLICGNYEVARKYLQALSKTLFYRTWAIETMSLLGNEEAIANHKEYGRLRSYMPDKDYMFQSREISELLGRQVMANGNNRLAYEYLQCANLLHKDLDSFVSSLGMGAEINYSHMPYMFQQAYVLWWSQNQHDKTDKIPSYISPNIINGLNQFYNDIKMNPSNKEKLGSRFGNTYWYYYFVH